MPPDHRVLARPSEEPQDQSMARLIYSMLASLDGFIADREGNFDWAGPDEEVHRFVNDLQRSIGTYLYGRRLYEVMTYWETADTVADQPDFEADYAAIWQRGDKIVFSTTLDEVSTARTRLERTFDAAAVAELVTTAERDLSVGGPELAGHALRAGLVDEIGLFLAPVVVGGGTPFLPDDVRLDLTLVEERRFGNGTVYLQYDVHR